MPPGRTAGPGRRPGDDPTQERLPPRGLANKVLKHYGLTLADWKRQLLRSPQSDRPVRDRQHLAALWPVAEADGGVAAIRSTPR